MVNSEQRQFQSRRHAYLIEDVGHVPLDRFAGDLQSIRDFLVPQALTNQPHDFHFAIGQSVVVLGIAMFFA